MSYLRDTAIVLKNEPFREHDAALTLFGKEHGKLQAVARGARSWKAKSLGHLEPFSEVEVMIAKGAAFDKLAVAHLRKPRLSFRIRLELLAIAGGFINIVDVLTRSGMPEKDVYGVIESVLNLADSYEETLSIERCRLLFSAAVLKVLDALGYGPVIDQSALSRKQNHQRWVLCSAQDDEHKQMISLLKFMRSRPLRECLQLTATKDVFLGASAWVDEAMKQAPFVHEPHGGSTLTAFLA